MDKGFANIDQLFEAANQEKPVVSFEETQTAFNTALLSGASTFGIAKLFNFKYGLMLSATSAIVATSVLLGIHLSDGNNENTIDAVTTSGYEMPVWENDPSSVTELDLLSYQDTVPGDTTNKKDTLLRYKANDMAIYVVKDSSLTNNKISRVIHINEEGEKPVSVVLSDSDNGDVRVFQVEKEMNQQIITIDTETSLGELEDIIELAIETEFPELNTGASGANHLESNRDDLEALHAYVEAIHDDVTLMNNTRDRYPEQDGELTRVSHTITEHTTEDELQAIVKEAGAAGIDIRYHNHTRKNKIRKLILTMRLSGGDRNDRVMHNIKRSGKDSFSVNLVWRQNKEGIAVDFGRKRNRTRVCN